MSTATLDLPVGCAQWE